jgi:hypothetical protein
VVSDQRTVKDPHSPSILRVQPVVDGKVKEYTVQDKVERAIQREYKMRFSLARIAPIMTTLLREQLCYLSNKALAWSIINDS